ncbi:histidine ammonia-lyase [Alloprevotella tannerae]|jgi:histidine ammonia-lyase|uniref:Histidine ammonia-lyase n=1 Tax=Alloprevotella tannerae TaxID=76122 RepID=A0A929RVA7_9BACT|nr:histidine ammonia-lyase [Alloprevotella tannerae]MBF0969888.1 histidine ammonia-lyase [Alloprevotella tannerae]MCG2650086.1 histidine ammonia-lyase [Alloprevotella tannerae]MCG2652513.1 histidine ammonia-lyase [Alloprevotella tannerae]
MKHIISAEHLSIERVGEIIEKGYKLELGDDARQRIQRCRAYLDKKIAENKAPIYGVTTGFGSLCNVSVSAEELEQLQVNLMMSHACGVGDRVPNEIVKIMLLLKIQSLSYGFSGCKLDTVERLIDFFNNDIYPIVYMQGSLGASGDLVPLAHLSLPLVGLGEVEFEGEVMTGAAVLEKKGWKPIHLASKEGLALLNGTQNMSSFAVWGLLQAMKLSDWADKIAVMSLDAYEGRPEPFTPAVHAVRPHKGQIDTAARIKQLLEGSELIKQPKTYVQDPYSFRCVPQVHGAAKDTINYVKSVIDTEINSATDNPTVCPDEDLVISAGNFHGEPIALPIDFLAIALNELANISERRIYKLVSGTRGLPSFLVANPGLNSGFMITQYTAASIVSLNKSLCSPASVDSIPSCQGQEDHVSMGANAAIKLYKVALNTERVLAIELFNAAQALDFRRPLKSSPAIEAIHAAYRKAVPFISEDEVMYPHIETSVQFLRG